MLKMEHPEGSKMNCISKKQANVNYTELSTLVPDIIPYHDCLISCKHLYTQPGIRLGNIENNEEHLVRSTYQNMFINHHRAKFMIYDKHCYDMHGVIVLSQLIANKCLVVLVTDELPDNVVEFYSYITIPTTLNNLEEVSEIWNNTTARIITEISETFKTKYINMSKDMPYWTSELELEPESCNAVCEEPEDYHSTTEPAVTTRDKKGNQALHLSPTAGADSLPKITVIVLPITDNNIIGEMLVKYNMNTTRYPKNKITYIHQSEGTTLRESAEKAQTDIIILMAPDTLYLPHSMYAKVKLMLDNPEYKAVASNILGHYHINENTSYTVYSKYPDQQSLAFKKAFFLRYPDCKDIDGYFYENQLSKVWNLPFNFNCVRIHQDPIEEEYLGGTDNRIHKNLFDSGITEFMTKLYRKLKNYKT